MLIATVTFSDNSDSRSVYPRLWVYTVLAAPYGETSWTQVKATLISGDPTAPPELLDMPHTRDLKEAIETAVASFKARPKLFHFQHSIEF